MDAGLTATGDLTETNPKFKSIVDGNYIPAFDSPCRDASVGSTETEDIDGTPRVGIPDIGAFENAAVATTQAEIPGVHISLVPNLVIDNLRVQWQGENIDQLNYQIIGQNGQQIQTGQINSTNQELNVSNLSDGQYHVVFTSRDGTTTRSFVKIK
jgi:hypothetical protein